MSSSTEMEYWRFSTGLDSPGDDVVFAIRYQSGSGEYWDNAFEADYRLGTTVDGTTLPSGT